MKVKGGKMRYLNWVSQSVEVQRLTEQGKEDDDIGVCFL